MKIRNFNDVNSNSHHPEDLLNAFLDGDNVYYLNTPDGHNDVLIGTPEKCEADLCYHHELDSLPENWNLHKIKLVPEENRCVLCGEDTEDTKTHHGETHYLCSGHYCCPDCEKLEKIHLGHCYHNHKKGERVSDEKGK